jgi:hypothetical protein
MAESHLMACLWRPAALLTIGLTVVLAQPGVGQAQFNNKPYSFNTPTGSPGMSTATKQAIINEQLFDQRPKNILRAPSGELLSVEETKGGSALVRNQAGTVLPGYSGTSALGPGMQAGIFNAYFASNSSRDFSYFNSDAIRAINGWINMISPEYGFMIPGSAVSPVDGWTWMVARQ